MICFSQADTAYTRITNDVARNIIKELTIKDFYEKQIDSMQIIITDQNNIISLKDSVIVMLDSIGKSYVRVIKNNKAQMDHYVEINEIAFNQLTENKKVTIWYKITSFFNVICTTIYLLGK